MSWGWWQPGDAAPIVAVAIGLNDDGSTHTGIVYRTDEVGDQLHFLHLRFHCWLGDTAFSLTTRTVEEQQYHLLIPNKPRPMLQAAALRCRRIKREKPMIRFGFAPSRVIFDTRGRVQPPDNRGLNCATFVLRVFASVEIRLIDDSTWEHRPEDETRFTELLGNLKRYITRTYWDNQPLHREHMAHATRIAPDVASIRVRPEEVAGACLSEKLPVQFAQGREFGRAVLSRICPATPIPPPPTVGPNPNGASMPTSP